MERSIEEIGAKMDALGLWGAAARYNWAVKPVGVAFPYFCSAVVCDPPAPVRVRFMMLEGWQTLHDYVRMRIDSNFGFCSSPAELPHMELVFPEKGGCLLFRYDAGYLPGPADAKNRELAAKILWEAFGVMMRLEGDSSLPMKFSDGRAVFARVESPSGEWSDAPLQIPDPPPCVEKIALLKEDLRKAQDLPMEQGAALSIDFRLLEGVGTRDPRPRAIYELLAVDPSDGKDAFRFRTPIPRGSGLRELWEGMPGQVLKALVGRGRVPGELRTRSGRVFRMMRTLAEELPFRLTLRDSLPELG